jgi:glycosyltransferase involved in cell wall biosynthesis
MSHAQPLPPLNPDAFVTVAIPCLDEIRHIDRCIEDVMGQDYPEDRVEVIVADGGSRDGTRQRLDELSSKFSRLRWIDNPNKIQSAGMNEIIRLARGDVIVRLDAHCQYAPDYIRQSVAVLRETGAWNVGGSQRANAQTQFQRALCAALSSRLGVGGAAYRQPDAEGFVDTVFCGSMRREVFELAGMYDAAAITNEDAELNQRILESGGTIYVSPKIVSHYFPRSDFRSLARQYFRYGQGRARTLLKRRRFPRISPAIPFLMTCTGAVLLATQPLAPSTWLVFGGYAALTGVEALRAARSVSLRTFPTVWVVFPTIHVSHGVGFAVGLVKYALRPDWTAVPEYLPKQV